MSGWFAFFVTVANFASVLNSKSKMAISRKEQEKKDRITALAKVLVSDWDAGEARGLHPTMHKETKAVWHAARDLGYLRKDETPDKGGYYRFTRTIKAV